EDDAGGLIDFACLREEAHRDSKVSLWRFAFPDGEREERERLYAVEELGVPVAVKVFRLVGEADRRLAASPFPSIDLERFGTVLVGHVPVANDPLELRRWIARLVGVERDDERCRCIGRGGRSGRSAWHRCLRQSACRRC